VVQHRVLTAAVDDGLRRRADDLAAATALAIPDALIGVDDDSAAQLTTPDGVVLVESPNLGGAGEIGTAPGEGGEAISVQFLMAPDDSFRVLSRRIASPVGPVVLHVAAATDDVTDSVAALRNSLLVAIPATVMALAATIWLMVGRALRPVEEIRREVDAITETDFGRRVPVPASDDEIERLARTMNGMLDRLEGGVLRLQRFVADASHELRSPLTRIRTELEVDQANRSSADLAATHDSVLHEVVEMERLVGDLLYLARSDAGEQQIRRQPVDLDDLLLEEAERQRVLTDIEVNVSGVSGGQVLGDRAQLRRMVGNLASNAVRFAATSIWLAVEERAGSVVMSVADDGPGVAAADREFVFERFARTDEGRSRDDGGSGLGLSIARDVVSRHGGSIIIDPDHTPGTRVVVLLPATRDRGSS
jgi:signal transduction histidine kinase